MVYNLPLRCVSLIAGSGRVSVASSSYWQSTISQVAGCGEVDHISRVSIDQIAIDSRSHVEGPNCSDCFSVPGVFW